MHASNLKQDNNNKFQSAFMQESPIDSISSHLRPPRPPPDVISDAELTFNSIPFESLSCSNNGRSFLFMDAQENITFKSVEEFMKKMGCAPKDKIKVVSIFGNTGDGKSHTMNHTFFGGVETFRTSREQNSCTIGVFAAMQKDLGILCLDTEGLLGTTVNSNRRMRMLLKILAISDILIYRTRSERLHSDMFEFLGMASKAFCNHFAEALQTMANNTNSAKTLGPAVVIFHETRHTKPLESSLSESAEDKLRDSFARFNYDIGAFSSMRYVGIQTPDNAFSDFSKLNAIIRCEIENTTVRSARQPAVILQALRALNAKFSGEIIEKNLNPFPEHYFTCAIHCKSCNRRCQRSMGHVTDGQEHWHTEPCNYQHQYENKVYLCASCHKHGRQTIVKITTQTQHDSSWYALAKFAWRGSVIECAHCGEIYRAREHWYGNTTPEASGAIRTEIVHFWQHDDNNAANVSGCTAQALLDHVNYVKEAFTSISTPTAKVLSNWMADKVAPSYWKPNDEIIHCHACKRNFEKLGLRKHHCRKCGEGFCHGCSQNKMPVPEYKWHDEVRVCNACYSSSSSKTHQNQQQLSAETDTQTQTEQPTLSSSSASTVEADILPRKVGETIYNAISNVAAIALEMPKEIIKESARPIYWVPDAEAKECHVCKATFGTADELDEVAKSKNLAAKELNGDIKLHHCRRCGQAVCAGCSLTRMLVPERGWNYNVRVCDLCKKT